MAPTRMKLRVRRRGGAAMGDSGGAEHPEEEGQSNRLAGTRSSRRKTNNPSSTTTTVSPPPSSSSSFSAATTSTRAVIAAEEASPDSKCPICLDRFNNLAYLDRCLHRFCFPCIQEWSHNKAECPLCKQPFASILHSVRAEDDFKEYTLRQSPASGSVAATVALVAAMASAARNNHQMRLMLRRHRGAESGEAAARRRRRERGGRGRGGGVGESVWAWYLDSPPLALPPTPVQHTDPLPGAAEAGEDGRESGERPAAGDSEPPERGVIFEVLTELGGTVNALAADDRKSRRLMSRLVARRQLQREGGPVRRTRERETVDFRRGLYHWGIRVHGVAGVGTQEGGAQQQQRDITAESFRQHPTLLARLRPWLQRELTVLYGAHISLVDIVQRIIIARLSRHGLEDTPTIEEELRPFLLTRTDHFLHELVSFARSPLCLESYDLQAVYEPPAAVLEQLAAAGTSSESSSVIAISEGEEEGAGVGEGRRPAGNGTENPLQRATEVGSSLSLAAWDDETPGPSYSTAEPSAPLSFSPGHPEAAQQESAQREDEEEECLIVGYKKPIAERTPELVQLSSNSEEEEEPKQETTTLEQLLPPLTSPLSYLPTMPPSTSGSSRHEQEEKSKENEVMAADGRLSRQRSWSSSSERSRKSVSMPSPVAAVAIGRSEWQQDRDNSIPDSGQTERKRKRSRRGRERSRSNPLHNPKRHSSSPLHSSLSSSPPLADFSWDYHSSQASPLTSPSLSSSSSPSLSSSSWSSLPPRSPMLPSPPPLLLTRDSPSGSPGLRDKPSGKRKYKSRHLDNNSQDPTWRPSGGNGQSREKRRERKEKERRRRKKREKKRRTRKSSGADRRRSRLDRSPSVEIIYESTAMATQPPTHKRRRKRQRGNQISPPVVITLDSDSSHSDVININNINDNSSPLSSQHAVDFPHLPSLPPLSSTGAESVLHPHVSELPADILDRGSDSWEAEPQAASTSPIAVDNSDVDVETVEQRRSSLPSGPQDHQGPPRGGQRDKSGSGQAESDHCLLETLLNSLQGSCSTTNGPSNNISGHVELKGRPTWGDREHKYPSIPPPPLMERLVDGKDLPSLLSPSRMHSRNTPPPLKHKDDVGLLPPPPSMYASWGGEMLPDCSPAPSAQTSPSCNQSSVPSQRNSGSSFVWTGTVPPCSRSDPTSCCPSRFDTPDPTSVSVSSSAPPIGQSADADRGTLPLVYNDSLPLLSLGNSLSEKAAAASIGQLASAADSGRPHVSGDQFPRELLPDLQQDGTIRGYSQNDSLVPISPKVTAKQPLGSVGDRTERPSAHTDFHNPPEECPQPTKFCPETLKHFPTGCKLNSPKDSFLPTANRMVSSTAPAVEGWNSEQPGSMNSSSC